MTSLQNKIDFVALITVDHANPNGDPLAANRPRQDLDGLGEITDVCIKRKLRNRLMDMGEEVFVQSDDRAVDGYRNLRERANAYEPTKQAMKDRDREALAQAACEKWIDVRAFGQLFALQGTKKKDGSGVSVGIRGPVSIHTAFSVDPVSIEELQITKSVNADVSAKSSADAEVDADKMSSDRMGMKYQVAFGLYVVKGSINCQLAEKTGFSDEDAEKLKQALLTLFENDASSARPEGSMEVRRVFWWEHNCKTGQHSTATVHRSVRILHAEGVDVPKCFEDYVIELEPLEGLDPETLPTK